MLGAEEHHESADQDEYHQEIPPKQYHLDGSAYEWPIKKFI